MRTFGYHHVEPKRIPHPLGPGHLWRKCYFVHPSTQIPQAEQKSLWLTNSALQDGLPALYSNSVNIPYDDVRKSVKEAIDQNVVYQRNTSLTVRQKLLRDEISTGLVPAVMNAIYSHSDSSLPLWCHVTHRPEIETYWKKGGNNFLLQGSPDYLIRTSLPLPVFMPVCDIRPLPDNRPTYRPVNLQLFQRSFDTIDIFGGFRLGSKRPYPHTQIIIDMRSLNSRDQMVAHAARAQFGLTAAHAITVQLYEQQGSYPIKMPEILDVPITTQCVITNGHMFAFACYQLNGLDLDQHDVPNLLWVRGPFSLYESLDVDEGAIGVNDDCVQLLTSFLLNPLVEYNCRQLDSGSDQEVVPLSEN